MLSLVLKSINQHTKLTIRLFLVYLKN